MNPGLLYAPEHGWCPDGFHTCHRVPLAMGWSSVTGRTSFLPGRSYRRYAANGTKVMQKDHTCSRSAGRATALRNAQ